MESNRDEALKCLSIAQRHRDAGNLPSARRFCLKSKSLFPTPEAEKLLASILEDDDAGPSTAGSSTGQSAFTSGAEAHTSESNTRRRPRSPSKSSEPQSSAAGSSEKREYTAAHKAVVDRVKACSHTAYYEILAVSKGCDEAAVKKAYRKLALQLHPDKNGAPGADEAFKMVSKAFQILSDPQKRAIFDRHGSDPDSRFTGMSEPRGPGFSGGSPFASGGFEGEVSPEELFNMFFGGMPMGGGPGVFSASFGPGGFRTTRVRTNGRAAPNAAPQEAPSFRTIITQLAPLLLLFFFTFMSAIPNIFSTPPTPDPHYSFSPSSRFNMERHTNELNIRYHVNSAEFSSHPIALDMATAQKTNARPKLLDKFERLVERQHTTNLYHICQREMDRKERRKEAKSGFLGIGADWEAIKRIDEEKVESCEELRRLGVLS